MMDMGDLHVAIIALQQLPISQPAGIKRHIDHIRERGLERREPLQGRRGPRIFLRVQRERSIVLVHRHDTTGKGTSGNRRRGTLLRSEGHTSELQSLMRISYAVFCLKKKIKMTI